MFNSVALAPIHTSTQLLKVQGSHHRVVQLMGEAALRGQVTMILRRKVATRLLNGNAAAAAAAAVRYPYDVIVSRNENEGFGFVISSSQYYGSTIGECGQTIGADWCKRIAKFFGESSCVAPLIGSLDKYKRTHVRLECIKLVNYEIESILLGGAGRFQVNNVCSITQLVQRHEQTSGIKNPRLRSVGIQSLVV